LAPFGQASQIAARNVSQMMPIYRPTLGYRTFGPNGYSSNSMPNGFGGMRTYQSNGVTTNTMPNGLGGMNTFVTRPPSFVNPTFGTYGR
jgi:hypothetical protein